MKTSFFFLLLLSFNLTAQPDKKPGQHSLEQQIDSIITHYQEVYEIPGLSVGVVQADAVLFNRAYGVKNIHTNDPVSTGSIFHAASVSKLFTAQAIMLLSRDGKLHLEDRVVDLLPELTYADEAFEQVTVKQLLNHTAGLPDVNNYHWHRNNEEDISLARYMLSQKFKLDHAPGTAFRYSNLAYDLLGYIIARHSGTSFEDYIKANILLPNQMIESDFRYFLIADSLRVSPHSERRILGNIYPRSVYPYTREHAASSTLNTSTTELNHWMVAVLRDLRTHGEEGVFGPMIESSTSLTPHIGLGFQRFEVAGFQVAGHYGGDRGFRSYLLLVPEKNLGLILLANCDYNEDFRQDILHNILRLL